MYGSEAWSLGVAEKQRLDVWWLHLMRRVLGIRLKDRVRNRTILERAKTSLLSTLVEERVLRYAGHMYRYPTERWVSFASAAAVPGVKKTGKARQYSKHLSKLLKEKKLTTVMMIDKSLWRKKLEELYPKQSAKPQNSGNEENETAIAEGTPIADSSNNS